MFKKVTALVLVFGLSLRVSAAVPSSSSQLEAKDIYQSKSSSTLSLRGGPAASVILLGSTPVALGGSLDILFNTSPNLLMGVETGVQTIRNAIAIPVMYSLIYKMGQSAVKPYVGFSAGVTLLTASGGLSGEDDGYQYRTTPRRTGGGGMVAIPTVAFRPGIDISLSPNVSLFVESKLGLYLVLPFFAPQAGLSINL